MIALLVMFAGAVAFLTCVTVRSAILVHREKAAMLADLHAAERSAMLAWLTHCYLPTAIAALEGPGPIEEPAASTTAHLDVRVPPTDIRERAAGNDTQDRGHEHALAV